MTSDYSQQTYADKASKKALFDYGSSKNYVFALVAGETSGDTLGADLISELKRRYPNARFVGIGGPKMQALGFESWYPMETLSVMGFFEVLKSLRPLLKLRKQLIARLIDLKPDMFIGIDAPDFNFTVEKHLKRQHIPTVHYVGPSVWAWRESRLNKIKECVSGVLVLFPFEPDYYHRYQIPVAYVGHPLAKSRPETLDKSAAKKILKLGSSRDYTGVLVGSRSSEIDQMAPVYLQVAAKLSADDPQRRFLFPAVNEKAKQKILEFHQQYAPELKIEVITGQPGLCLQACDQALVTSGTASLECTIYQLPMVIAIKVHSVSYWIMKRLARTQWIGLPNILAQQSLVTECIQQDANVETIYTEMKKVFEDKSLRQKQIRAFEKQYQSLNMPSASLAADALAEWGEFIQPAYSEKWETQS